jgi:N-acetyl-gamma-glutamyl-phosphate reductase
MEVKKVGLLGGRGYVGRELIQLLDQHKRLNISSVFSLSKAGQPVDLDTDDDLVYQNLALENIVLADEDAFILALPNNESQKYIDLIFQHNSKAIIIDLSADHRFDDAWEYRVPELSENVQLSKISNPGCYASAMQFMLAPLKKILVGPVHLYGISGYSGAGATPNRRNDQEALKDNILPYSLVSHIHEQEVKAHSYPDILFTPHVGNFFRGIMMTGNFILSELMLPEEIYNLFISYYDQKPLISIQQTLPNMQDVQNTSNVIIGGFAVDQEINRLTFCCALDNLLKGAATQAVQNLNSAFEWEDNLGII